MSSRAFVFIGAGLILITAIHGLLAGVFGFDFPTTAREYFLGISVAFCVAGVAVKLVIEDKRP